MAVENKIISFWKQVKLRSSDMFTKFKVGIGVKVPTHKLHIKDSTDPIKVEGVQSDTSSSTKFLVLDGSDVIKHSTGTAKTTEEVQDIVGAMFTSNTETGVAATYEDGDGTIDLVVDHDAASNFVVEEHYRWDTDISGTATIHTNNITDLHGAGVDGAANQLLTDDGDGTVTSEANLTFDGSTLNVGGLDAATIVISRTANDDNIGGRLYIEAGDAAGTNKAGGDLNIIAGRGTGNAVGGSIFFQSTAAGSSGDSINGAGNIVEIDNVGNLQIDGGLTVGSTSFVNSSGLIQVANQSNITGVGTISSGTWQGTAIASAYLDSDTAHLSGAQTFTGAKTFEKKITLDGNQTVTPSDDGVALHVDAQDITDGNTSASGTAVTYNHIAFENPRLLATNSSVTTTDASTVFIKGQPVAHTNQTITNAWALKVAGGSSYFGGIITVAGNEIKDDDGTTCITFDSSGNTTIAGTTSGTFSGNLTGNASGSSGSCTGNAATATALTSGDKTIDGDLTIDGNNITNNASAANFNIASSRILELQHAGSYDIQLGNSTNADVLKVAGDSEVVTVNGNLTVNGDSVTFESANADDPIFTLKNTNNGTNDPAQMIFIKDRGAAPAVGTNIGEVRFVGEDSAQNSQEYGGFLCEIDVATNGQESGQFGIWVATHDGELQYGLQLTGGSEEDEVDVSIGQGSNSLTSVAGNLDVTGNVLPGITYVKILPSDFMPDDGGRPAMIDDTGSDRWLESHGTSKLYAFVDIPVGFKATHVDVYGSATSAVTVYEADVNSKTVTSKGTGNIGTQINITDVNSDATNYILIELAQASGEEVYGGKLTIAKI